jgi:hypothetical protein
MKKMLACTSVMAMLAVAAPAMAYDEPGGVQVGTLTCHEHRGLGLFLGSSRRVSCLYRGPDGSSRYAGHITDLGVDVGYHGPSDLVWAVFAPTDQLGPGALSGHFGGATAGGAVGVGVSANALIGGSDRSVQLQPLSISGNTGLDVAAGVAGMTLHHVPGSYEPD